VGSSSEGGGRKKKRKGGEGILDGRSGAEKRGNRNSPQWVRAERNGKKKEWGQLPLEKSMLSA